MSASESKHPHIDKKRIGTVDIPEVILRFWFTFNWSDNPWIRDRGGNMLAKASFQRIEACPLDQLGLERTGSAEFVLTIPRPAHQSKHHSAAKLQR